MRYAEIVKYALMHDPNLILGDQAVYFWIHECAPGSLRELERQTGRSRGSLTAACRRLAAAKWLKQGREGLQARGAARLITTTSPECQLMLLKHLQDEYPMAANKGEWLMKRQLDLRVRSRAFYDNVRPEELTQPTGHRLELDRLYFEVGVAFEFNGFYHHDPPEDAVPAVVSAVRATKTRDAVKQTLSTKAGITVVSIMAASLSFEVFGQLIPGKLAQRAVDTDCHYARDLARICEAYASYARSQASSANRGNRAPS